MKVGRGISGRVTGQGAELGGLRDSGQWGRKGGGLGSLPSCVHLTFYNRYLEGNLLGSLTGRLTGGC